MGAIRVERGTAVFGASEDLLDITLSEAPGDSNWFARITNTQRMATGPDAGTASDRAPNDLGAVIERRDIETFRISRRSSAENVDYAFEWEAWIYQAGSGDDNEILVLEWSTVSIADAATAPIGDNPVATDTDVQDVVPIILAVDGRESTQDFSGTAITAEVNNALETVMFRRTGTTGQVTVSYALVEFKGVNWTVETETHSFSSAGVTEQAILTGLSDYRDTMVFSTFKHNQNTQARLSYAVWPFDFTPFMFLNLRIAGGSESDAEAVIYLVENSELAVTHDNSFIGNADRPLSSDTLHTQAVSLIASGDAGLIAYTFDTADTDDWPQANWAYRWASTTSLEFERSRANGGTPDVFYQLIDFSGLPYTAPTPTAQGYEDLTNKLREHYEDNFAAFPTQSRNLPFTRPDNAPWVSLAVNFLGAQKLASRKSSGRYLTSGEISAKYYTPYKTEIDTALSSFGDTMVAVFSDTRIAGAWFSDTYLRQSAFDDDVGQWFYEFVAPFTWKYTVDHGAEAFAVADGFDNLYDGLNGRFKTQVADTQSVSVEYGNLPYTIPTDGSTWCRFTVATNPTVRGMIGERGIPGIAFVQIFQPIKTGDASSLALADTIVEKFIGGVEDSISFGAASVISVGDDGRGWWQTNVSLPFLQQES